MISDACRVVDALAAYQMDVLRRINRKFAAMQSLAQLLEQLGDISSAIPNLAGMVPVIAIDLELYNAMIASCPWLNLPPASGTFNQLQVAAQKAYSNLLRMVLRHPYSRLGAVQAEMARFQASINDAFLQADDFLRCLHAVCVAGAATAASIAALSDASVSSEINKFGQGFVAANGNAISEAGQIKYQQTVAVSNQLRDLGAS